MSRPSRPLLESGASPTQWRPSRSIPGRPTPRRLAFVAALVVAPLAPPFAAPPFAAFPFAASPLAAQTPTLLSDLAVRFGARTAFGGDWTIFRPCDALAQLVCRPGLVPQLQPDIRFGLLANGSVSDRLFVDVDYDQTREFAGANRFRLWYQGRADEFVQRLEIGDVTFALPESRFLTRGVPAGNFGLVALGQVGDVQLQTVFAQQRGARRTREYRLGGVGTAAGVVYQDTLALDDADYVKGQFFFLVHPAAIAGSPHLDVLALRAGDAPPNLAPGPQPIQLYRMERDPLLRQQAERQQVEGYIRADAELGFGPGAVRESGWFRYLRAGEDYYLHPSGLWLALRVPLAPGEALAVAFVTETGVEVGDYDPELEHNAGLTPTLHLLRSTEPQHQPGRPTWDREMRQVYRLSGSDDVDRHSLEVTVSLGEESWGRTFRVHPDGRPLPFLRLFGLDLQAPLERVDPAAVFQPAEESGGRAGANGLPGGLQGTYLVLPTLRPFFDPPPVPTEGLSSAEVALLLGDDRNARIYEADDPFERGAAGLYRLNVSAEVRSQGVTSVFSLGAFGLRQGSERVFLGDRLLQPLSDYVIDYDVGVVTLLQPEALLLRSSSDVLRVSWEEASVFQSAPVSTVGLSARVPLTRFGSLNLVGLYQMERELVNRPRFGSEPETLGLVGATTELAVPLPTMTSLLERAFGREAVREAALRVEGELAVSLPDPNRSGDSYLDDFDAGNERRVSLLSQGWHLGSAPASTMGAEGALPAVPDETNRAGVVWQHSWIERDPLGDSIGVFDGYFPEEIDRRINVEGTQAREPGLRLGFGAGGSGPVFAPSWSSVTTLLSPQGADLTYTEYLDVYVAGGEATGGVPLVLVIDLGLVSEDAMFVDSFGSAAGIHPETGRSWGLGVLDQEADPLRGEIWNPTLDLRGSWVESCRAEPGRAQPIGSAGANCTAGNGRRDGEDLNGNGALDTTERTIRYVVSLGGSSPYLARDHAQTETPFRLYRIPLRGPLAIAPAGDFTDADWRSVQFLRVTLAGDRSQAVTLARMRLIGSRWVKRGVSGVLEGIGGDDVALGGRVDVGPVSVLTEGAAYQAPPGVLSRLDDPASTVSGRGVEFNEKSLGLVYEEIGPGDRAEVYYRFLQRPQSFLSYGELRLWAVAREGAWGEGVPTDFFVKVGTDAENYYMYRAPLTPAANSAAVLPEDWLPEHRLRFNEWTLLRLRAEQRLLDDPPGPGDPPVIEWSADSLYVVVLRDRARAPNLAAVREISLGVWNRGDAPVAGELWVNEMRLGNGVRDAGTARFLTVELDGGDLFQARVGYTGTGPDFQQLDEDPTRQSERAITLSGAMELGGVIPGAAGWDVPLSVSHTSTGADPFFLAETDLRAEELPGLRTPGGEETRVTLALRPRGNGTLAAGAAPVTAASGLDARVALSRGSGTTLTAEHRSRSFEGSVGYSWRPAARTVSALPDFLDSFARILLPGFLYERMAAADLRWTPEEVGARTGFVRRDLTVERFDEILTGSPGRLSRAPESLLETRSRLALRPFAGLGLSLDLVTVRDVLGTEEGVRDPRVRPLVEEERGSLLGVGFGWETRRELVGRLTFQPALPPWLRADLGVQTRYVGERNPGLVRFEGVDSVPLLLRNASGERDIRTSLTVDPASVTRGLVSPVTVSWQDGVGSSFLREGVDPGAGFQLGWGTKNAFAEEDGLLASALVSRRFLSSGSGLRLPASAFMNVNFQSGRTAGADRRSDRVSRTRSWPDVRGGFADLPLPDAWRRVVTRLSGSAGFRLTRQDASWGGGLLQRRRRDDRVVPMEAAVQWSGGIVTRYRGQIGWGEGSDPTGVTERKVVEHGLSLESRFALAAGLAAGAATQPRISLSAEYAKVVECRTVTGGETCVDFVDQLNRRVSLLVEALVSDLEVGGQLSLVDRRSFTGLMAGFTQFQIGIWGRMVFESGPIERLGGARGPF